MPSKAKKIKCPACGKQNEFGSKYCSECGTQFNASKTNAMFRLQGDTMRAFEPSKKRCPYCMAEVTYRISQDRVICPKCHHEIPEEYWALQVSGRNANEVQSVTEALVNNMAQKNKVPINRNPWISGSFYLASTIVVVILFLVVARSVSPLALPVVIIGALLTVSVVGALQLRQDKTLSEKNFLSLMWLTFSYLPFIRTNDTDQEKQQR